MKTNTTSFQSKFDQAYRYALKIVHGMAVNNPDEKQDLLQDFCLAVLSNKTKYGPILQYKRTVYLLLKGICSNQRKKLKPDAYEVLPEQMANHNFIAKIDLEIIAGMVPALLNNNSVPDKTKQAVIRDHKARKLSNIGIAKKHQISTGTLHRIISGKTRKTEKPLTLQYWELYLQGFNHHEIADTLNVSPHSVSQNLYKINTKLRNIFNAAA